MPEPPPPPPPPWPSWTPRFNGGLRDPELHPKEEACFDHLLSQVRKRYILFTSFSCHRQFSPVFFSCRVCACVRAYMCTHIYVYIYACIYTLNSGRGSQQHQPHHRKQPHATSALRASSLAALGLSAAGTCHDRLEAALALGGVLPSGALVAQDLVVLGHEGLIGQGAEALGAAEAGVVPVAVLVVHLLGTKQGAGRRERGLPSR